MKPSTENKLMLTGIALAIAVPSLMIFGVVVSAIHFIIKFW